MVKVMIDAGHYGERYNQGIVPDYYESERMWKLSEYLVAELEKYNIEVYKTRKDKNKDVDVFQRGVLSKGMDLLISLHSNAVTAESVNRAVIIKPVNGKADAIATTIGETVRDTMKLPNMAYQLLAKPYSNNDQKIDWYGLIRGATSVGTPSLIVEHSFHTNKKACEWLLNDVNLRRLAVNEAKAIAEFFNAEVVPIVKTIYRVQVGAYTDKTNAEATLKRLKAKGFDGFIVQY